MEEKTLLAFAKWMQSKDEKLAKIPAEQLAVKVAEALKTPEGQKQLTPLFQQFQSEVSEIMRSGGKMDYAVKRMDGGGSAPKDTDAQRDVLSHSDIPRKDYYETVGMGNYLYKKIDGEWYENMPDTWGDRWIPFDGEHHYDELERLAAGSPSTRELDRIRNSMGTFHPGKVVNGSHYVLKTMPAKTTKEEAIENVLQGADYSKPSTWYKNGVDSVIVKTTDPRSPKVSSNQDLTVKAYRNIPAFRKVADAVGFVPEFEKSKIVFKQNGGYLYNNSIVSEAPTFDRKSFRRLDSGIRKDLRKSARLNMNSSDFKHDRQGAWDAAWKSHLINTGALKPIKQGADLTQAQLTPNPSVRAEIQGSKPSISSQTNSSSTNIKTPVSTASQNPNTRGTLFKPSRFDKVLNTFYPMDRGTKHLDDGFYRSSGIENAVFYPDRHIVEKRTMEDRNDFDFKLNLLKHV